MKVIAFFAFVLLAANAFNLSAYQSGFDTQLNFNGTQIQQGLTCLGALSGDIENTYQLLRSLSFDKIVSDIFELLNNVEQFKTDAEITCLPYIVDLAGYLYNTTQYEDLEQKAEQNVYKYLVQIIQQVAKWADFIASGQDFEAGQVQAYIAQILLGIEQPEPYIFPNYIDDLDNPVAFNDTEFFNDYLGTVFQELGINATFNVSELGQCTTIIENATLAILNFKEGFSTMDKEEKVNNALLLASLGFDALRECKSLFAIEKLTLVPMWRAFKEDPINFALEVVNRIALNLPELIELNENEVIAIAQGNYTGAGELRSQELLEIFGGLVDFTN